MVSPALVASAMCVDVDPLGEQQAYGQVLTVVEQSAQEVE